MNDQPSPNPETDPKQHPFRRAVLRGLGVVLPPLLTIVFFLWLWNSVQDYVLVPLETGGNALIRWSIRDVYPELPVNAKRLHKGNGPSGQGTIYVMEDKPAQPYALLASGELVPNDVFQWVSMWPGEELPTTAEGVYKQYVATRFLRRRVIIPIFLCVFVMILYLLGKFIAARVGRIAWTSVESIINRLPMIRTVYGSVKQVTDFVFSDPDIEYTRVVAVEYPRKGIWSVGFVTGESMLDLRSAANEPVLSVLMPTSPMPATGFTVTIRKSETIDLNISVDQAFQFIVSCGVVIPASQRREDVQAEFRAVLGQNDSTDASLPDGRDATRN